MRNQDSPPFNSEPIPQDTDLTSASPPHAASKFNPVIWWRYVLRKWHSLVDFVSPIEGTLLTEPESPIAAVMPIWTSMTRGWTAGSFYVNETEHPQKTEQTKKEKANIKA